MEDQQQPGEWIVPNPDGLDYSFAGVRLIDAYHHDTGTVQLYRTQGGRFVLRQRRSLRPGEIVTERTDVIDSIDAAIDLLPSGPGRNAIRRALGLRAEIRLD